MFRAGNEDRRLAVYLRAILRWLAEIPGRLYAWLKGVLTPNPQPVGLLSTAVNAALPGLGLIKIGIVIAAIGGVYYTVWSRGYDRCETEHAAANARVHKEEAALEVQDAATFAREREIGEKLARDFAAASNLQKHVLDSSTAAALNKNGGVK
jgi:drug/metabolite transporter superfamily protein YnfA